MPGPLGKYTYRNGNEQEEKDIAFGNCNTISKVKEKLAEVAELGNMIFRIYIYCDGEEIYDEENDPNWYSTPFPPLGYQDKNLLIVYMDDCEDDDGD
ncbi:hypothetical protein IWW36_002870, partial [Coemansia brasiliensis]